MCFIVALPLAALFLIALQPDEGVWYHLVTTVLPRSILTTILLMTGVGIITGVVGAGTAWLVTMYDFPGRRYFQWLLLLPLAIPTYISAFSYVEIWDYSGPIQSTLRAFFGWQSARDYWFPDIRTLGGAIFVLSIVLYPYVYLTCRASFIQQSVCALEVGRTLGRSGLQMWWSLGLPMARPALAAGITLAMMECLNDIGAVEHFGVNTLTVSIYTTWLERGSLSGAAEIAVVMLVIVFALLWFEKLQRKKRGFHNSTGKFSQISTVKLNRIPAIFARLICALPVLLGFMMPGYILLDGTLIYIEQIFDVKVWSFALNSILMAAGSSVLVLLCGLVIVFSLRVEQRYNRIKHAAARFTSIGYAVPGTVLAIGILVPLTTIDRGLVDIFGMFDIPFRGVFSGTLFALFFAYLVRFMAISTGALESGYERLSKNLDHSARTLGEGHFGLLSRVHLPMLKPAIGAAMLLIFVDVMKELPATLVLRPFNFDTLATHVYTYASLDLFKEAAPAALLIVIVGLIPILLLDRLISSGRPGSN